MKMMKIEMRDLGKAFAVADKLMGWPRGDMQDQFGLRGDSFGVPRLLMDSDTSEPHLYVQYISVCSDYIGEVEWLAGPVPIMDLVRAGVRWKEVDTDSRW